MSKSSKKIWQGNVRDAALSILMEINNQQAYSNLLLNRTISRYKLDSKDRALLTELTYGTLQHRMTLDYYLEPFIRGKLESWVRELLRLSLYQIVYLSKIPAHAAVNEAVEIAKRRGHKGIASMVNGILRSVLRSGVRSLEEIQDPLERLAIETSHPLWLIQRWNGMFGFDTTEAMARLNNTPPPVTVRVNTTKAAVEDVAAILEAEGFTVEKGEIVPESLLLSGGNPAHTEAFEKGFITIQDESSMLPVLALAPAPGMRILDMCAAPGGKTTFIAEKIKDEGEILAHDLHAHKIGLIEDNAKRLGLSSITAKSGDSRKLVEEYGPNSFDRILLDAPCSGFGVIRRKPEIKYTKTVEDVSSLTSIQKELLETARELLKPGGILVYSTCTLERAENIDMATWFCDTFDDIEKIPLPNLHGNDKLELMDDTLQVLPQHFGGDGFFVAAFQKKGEQRMEQAATVKRTKREKPQLKESIYSFQPDQLKEWLTENGEKPFRATQILDWLYKKRVATYDEMTNLPASLREKLRNSFALSTLSTIIEQKSADGTVKFLFQLQDGYSIETVLMKHEYGYSVCVTTQVGCRIGCTFCASTLGGLKRHLLSGEIVEQVVKVQRYLDPTEERVSSVVIMGIGEPFDNYDAMMNFLKIINDSEGLNIGARHITVSTSGIIPKIKQFADEQLQINFAVSLHAPNMELRSRLMPINKAYKLPDLMDAIRYYVDKTGRRVTFEYGLFGGVNDQQVHAEELADLIEGIRCHVNLIPVNYVPERDYVRTPREQIFAFEKVLKKRGVNVTIRREQGSDIDAACGQLRAKEREAETRG